jgi:hypothetical protein
MADDIRKQLEEEARLRKLVAESAGEYLKLLKDIKAMHKNIAVVDKERLKKEELINQLVQEQNDAIRTGNIAERDRIQVLIDLEKVKKKILDDELKTLNESLKTMTKIAKETKLMGKGFAAFTQVKNDVSAIVNTVKFGYGKMKAWAGLFDMDKSLRMASLSMGVLDKRGKIFRTNIKEAANSTIDFGVGIKELAQLQASYSEELGRSPLLGENALKDVAALSVATSLGAEATGQMLSDFELQGMSAKSTAKFIEDTMNDASRMGLNATKVIKNIQQNMKLLNKYNFKDGVKGLKAMAETAAKLGIDVNSVASMADKLFDIEGAVDMSAQLQVLGGAWSSLADPFHLMYMARNDMGGLTTEIANAAAQSAKFNSQTKQFEVSALEMHRLRKVAEQTGMDYETLATAAKNAAKFSNIRKQIRVNFDKDTKEFLENTATLNENGEAIIRINGEDKLLKQLNQMDKQMIDSAIKEKKSMAQRAKDSQTFDERLSNIVVQFKQMLLPILEGIDEGLRPVVDKFADTLRNPEFKETFKKVAEAIGGFVATVGKFIYENPGWSLALFGIFEAAKWFKNGMALGAGFNTVASVGGGGGIGGGMLDGLLRKGKKGGWARNLAASNLKASRAGGLGRGGMLMKGLKGGGLASIVGLGAEAGRSFMDNPDSTAGKMLGIGGSTLSWGGTGAMIGSLFGPLGTLIGGGLGGLIGLGKGIYDEYYSDEAMAKKQKPLLNDGVIFNDRDKLMKMDDGSIIAGTNVNGNKDLANAITGAKSDTMKIEFGEIHFKFDELKITSPGHPGLSVDVLNDPIFIRNLTRLIHTETEKVIDGGKVKPK